MELSTQLKEDLHQINVKNAIKGKVHTSLASSLALLTKDRLSYLASYYEVAGRSKMNKQALADALTAPIADAGNLEASMLIADEREWTLFQKLIDLPYSEDESVLPGSYLYLLEQGLLFIFYDQDKLIFAVPDEIKESYRKISKGSFLIARERFQLVHHYLTAASNLYGICSLDKLVEIFNSQNEEQLTESELTLIIVAYSSREQCWFCDRENVLADYFADEDDGEIEAFLEKVKLKPYYIPEKAEFLKYADTFYFEKTPQISRLQDYLERNLCKDKNRAESLVDDIQLASSMEAPLAEILEVFERQHVPIPDRQQLEALMPLLVDVINHTRIWSNRGHTPNELGSMAGRKSTPSNVVYIGDRAKSEKIGRNDPCPCGSGKKYKKCCL